MSKTRLDKLEVQVENHDKEIQAFRKFKHDTNGHIHNHNGKFDIMETQQKNIIDELVGIRQDLREWIKKTNGLLNWQLSIKFMLVGGLGVGSVMVAGAWAIFNLYLNHYGVSK